MGMSSVSAKRHHSVSVAPGNEDMAAAWEEHGRMSRRASVTLLFASSLAGWGLIYGICALSF